MPRMRAEGRATGLGLGIFMTRVTKERRSPTDLQDPGIPISKTDIRRVSGRCFMSTTVPLGEC